MARWLVARFPGGEMTGYHLNTINDTASTTSRRVLIMFPALPIKTMITNVHSIISRSG